MGNVEIKVPQKDGEISISRDGNVHEPTVYEVKSGKVSVAEDDAAHFLAVVDGAELARKTDADTVASAVAPQ